LGLSAALFQVVARVSEPALEGFLERGLARLYDDDSKAEAKSDLQEFMSWFLCTQLAWCLPLPLLASFGCVATYVGIQGLRAAKDFTTALYYMTFKFFCLLSALWALQPARSLWLAYAVLVCRSHSLDLASRVLPITFAPLGACSKHHTFTATALTEPLLLADEKLMWQRFITQL